MMKKILCPVDDSPAAINAIEYAARLARHFNSELVLLQIVEIPTMQDVANISGGLDPDIGDREDASRKKLGEYCSGIIKEFAIRCSSLTKVSTADVDRALKKEIEEDFDLVVMGTNGADDLNQFFFGTHTYRVIQMIGRPLLMLPAGCTFRPYHHVVYASDYEKEDVKTIRNLLNFTGSFNAGITVLHISEKPTAVSQEVFQSFRHIVEDSFEDSDMHFQRVVEEDAPAGIDRYMREKDADLLVLMTKRRLFIERIFHYNIIGKLSYIATYPVLVYHS